jgi:hypothetical protein
MFTACLHGTISREKSRQLRLPGVLFLVDVREIGSVLALIYNQRACSAPLVMRMQALDCRAPGALPRCPAP